MPIHIPVHSVVTILAAAWVGFSAVSVFIRAKWVVEPIRSYGVPESWWNWLGTAKAAGAVGLVAGLFVPVIGPIIGRAAGIGLILYFTGAVITVLRARAYSHVAFPLLYVGSVIASMALA